MKFNPNYENEVGGPKTMSWVEFNELYDLTESELAEIAKDDDPAIKLEDCNPEQRRVRMCRNLLTARIKTGVRKLSRK